MQVIQLLPTISKGDAVSNDALQMHRILHDAGYETRIYADNIVAGLNEESVHPFEEMPVLLGEDILVYHLSIGSRLHEKIKDMDCRKVFVYHNITPSHFFTGYAPYMEQKCRQGLAEIASMCDVPDYVLADSAYNKQHLTELGYKCPMDVLPILFPMEEYAGKAEESVLEKYRDGKENILFTGRIAPNKCQQDIIAAFYEYHKLHSRSRLILVGNDAGMERYSAALKQYVAKLGLEDAVVFTGKVTFGEILAYYQVADTFLCMSEHEGFCVPLLEAMYFGVPIVAYDAGAVKETLGGSGVLLTDKTPQWVAQVLSALHKREDLKKEIVEEQNKRLKAFSYEEVSKLFLQDIQQFAKSKKEN